MLIMLNKRGFHAWVFCPLVVQTKQCINIPTIKQAPFEKARIERQSLYLGHFSCDDNVLLIVVMRELVETITYQESERRTWIGSF